MSYHSLQEWQTLAGKLKPHHQLFINGRFEDADSGKCFSSINPANQSVLAEVAAGDATDIDRAVAAARAADRKSVV